MLQSPLRYLGFYNGILASGCKADVLRLFQLLDRDQDGFITAQDFGAASKGPGEIPGGAARMSGCAPRNGLLSATFRCKALQLQATQLWKATDVVF